MRLFRQGQRAHRPSRIEGARAPIPAQLNPVTLRDWATATQAELGLETLYIHVKKSTGDIDLDLVVVPKAVRKAGTGTAFMQALTQLADAHGRRITLTPALRDPRVGTTSRARLKRFYKRFGFVENKGRNKDFTTRALMYRRAQPRGQRALRTVYQVEIEYPEDEEAYQGSGDYVTQRAEGTLPVATLLGLKGARGEHHLFDQSPTGRYTPRRWQGLVESIRREGVKSPVLVVVEWTDQLRPAMRRALAGEQLAPVEAFVYEGNHRIRAAAAVGLTEVPVEVRWFGLSERKLELR